ncbi:MAG: TonB-dependent receptor [Deltaproteobacteria bacterium]|nr:TonB-dependent receptor [Deltaproteobacteria bacterium]
MRIGNITKTSLAAALLALVLAPTDAGAQAIREEVKRPEPKLTKPPKLLKFVEAGYPPAAKAKKIAGAVTMTIIIDAQGKVSKVKVVSAPDASLGLAAEAAARQFLFSPAEVDGKPAPVQIRYTYNFVIKQQFVPHLPAWLSDEDQGKSKDVFIGRVREQGTRLPLAGASVAIAALGIEVQSDARGRFAVNDMPAGKYEVQALSLQHKKQTAQVEIREGEQAQATFYLEPLQENPYETVVRGKRRQTVVTRVTLRGRQLTSVPGTFGDPIRVVENLPGLARTPYVGGALLIRGAAPGDSGTFYESVRIPILFHFFGGPSVLNPAFIDRIDYYPGNADARYGRLTAGVVDVGSRNTFSEQWKGSFDINLLYAGIFLNVPLTEKVSVAAALRRSYFDALLPSILDAAGAEATTVVPVYYDYQLRVDVKLDGNDRLWVLFFGSDDDLKIVSNESDSDIGIDLGSKTTFHRALAQWRASFAKGRGVSKLQPYAGYDRFSLSTTGVNLQIGAWVVGLREDAEYRLRKDLRLRFGVDSELSVVEFDANIPLPKPYRDPGASSAVSLASFGAETEKISIQQTIGSVGLYVDAIFDATSKLQLIPGLRFDLFFYQEDQIMPSLDPRLTVRYALNKATTLKAAAGMYSLSPPPNQANAVLGNPNLVLEHAAHFSVGVERQLWIDALKLDLQLYYLRRYDLTIRSDVVQIADGIVRQLRYQNEGEGFSTGLELMLKHEVTRHFYGWVAYTLALSKAQREPDGEMVRFPFDQRHILTTVASFRFGRGWELGVRFRLVSGRPETPILGGVFDADGGKYTPIEGEEFSVSRQTFHQLDVRIEKTWIFKLWRFALYLDVQNVYNAENPEATLYDYRFAESGPLRGLPLVPTLGVKGSF